MGKSTKMKIKNKKKLLSCAYRIGRRGNSPTARVCGDIGIKNATRKGFSTGSDATEMTVAGSHLC